MRNGFAYLLAVGLAGMLASSAFADIIYNNLTPNNLMAIATRPESNGNFEIEAGDDFVVSQQTAITSATFVGLIVPGPSGTPSVSDVVAEMYRVFPLDSDPNRTPHVPTRVNSPSDVAFASRSSSSGELSSAISVLSTSFTALNSVQPGGIHP